MPTLQELAVAMGSPQAPIVTDLVKNMGVLETAETGYSSKSLLHEYPVAVSDPEASVRGVNAGIVATSPINKLVTLQLPEIGALMEADRTVAASLGGWQAFVDRYTWRYMEACLTKLERCAIYGNIPGFGIKDGFLGFHQIAKANGTIVKQCGAPSGSRTSIFAVHYKREEVQFVFPENDRAFIVNFDNLGGGSLLGPTSDTATGARNVIYQGYFSLNCAFQAGNANAVSAITQIGTSNKPTASDIDLLLDAVKALADGMTYIYVNRAGRRFLSSLKSQMFIDTNNVNFNTIIATWNNIPVVLAESIDDNETAVLD